MIEKGNLKNVPGRGLVSSFEFIGMPDTILLARIRSIAVGDRIIALQSAGRKGEELIIRNPEFCARYLDYIDLYTLPGGLLFVRA